MYQNETSSNYYKEILLSDILSIFSSDKFDYNFELKTTNLVYFCADPSTKIKNHWESIIKQALMPISEEAGAVTRKKGENSCQVIEDICQQYQIFEKDLLGSGQFGSVHPAVHRLDRREVAVKIIDKSRFPTKQEAQLKNEVSILENLGHPGIVKLEKMFETPQKIFVVMEKLKGDMLDMILQSEKKRLDERVTRFLIYQVYPFYHCNLWQFLIHLFKQILIALKHLHSQNIVHCDLKPENVLLSSDADFPQVKNN